VAVGVSDAYGSLERRTLVRYLCKGLFPTPDEDIDFKRAGAGLGLATVLRYATRVVIRVIPGLKTDCIGVVDLVDGRRESREAVKRVSICYPQRQFA
jgi:hypothetical protein